MSLNNYAHCSVPDLPISSRFDLSFHKSTGRKFNLRAPMTDEIEWINSIQNSPPWVRSAYIYTYFENEQLMKSLIMSDSNCVKSNLDSDTAVVVSVVMMLQKTVDELFGPLPIPS